VHSELHSQSVTCPHCWEPHEVWVDTSAGSQVYIEDCSVCCHPMQLNIVVDADGSAAIDVDVAQ
jgi:hypothetical protein